MDEIKLAPKTKEQFMYGLGAFVILCAISIVVCLFFLPIPQANHDAIMLAIGAILGWGAAVVSYFYGSSKGSSDKTQLLEKEKPTS